MRVKNFIIVSLLGLLSVSGYGSEYRRGKDGFATAGSG